MAKAMQPQKMRFSQAIQTPMYKNLVNNTLGDPARGARFIANITSAVAVNPALQECNPGTILAGAFWAKACSCSLRPSWVNSIWCPLSPRRSVTGRAM